MPIHGNSKNVRLGLKVNPRDGRLRSVGLAALDLWITYCGEMQLAKTEMGLPAKNFILWYSGIQSPILSDSMYVSAISADTPQGYQ